MHLSSRLPPLSALSLSLLAALMPSTATAQSTTLIISRPSNGPVNWTSHDNLEITSTGVITSSGVGVQAVAGGFETLDNKGLIAGRLSGILFKTAFPLDQLLLRTLNNDGEISSERRHGIEIGGQNVTITTLSNQGKISGSSSGINNGGTITTLYN